MQPTHRWAVAGMVLVTLLWSMAGVVTRQLEAARSFEVTFWRSLFTALTLMALLPLAARRGWLKPIDWRARALWASGAAWSVMFTAFMVALTLTTVANTLITMALAPLFTALLARAVLREPIRPPTALAIALAFAGIGWMYDAQLRLSSDGTHLLGIAVALAVPLASAVQWTVVQRSGRHGARVELMLAVLVGAVISALVTLPLAWPLRAPAGDVAWLALLGVAQLAIPCALVVACARVLPAPEVALLALLEVLFGTAWAWWGAGEAPSPHLLWGGGLVLLALAGNAWWQLRRSEPVPPPG